MTPRPGSFGGEPMTKEPGGTTTISGQSAHSWKLSLIPSARSCATDSDCACAPPGRSAPAIAMINAGQRNSAIMLMGPSNLQKNKLSPTWQIATQFESGTASRRDPRIRRANADRRLEFVEPHWIIDEDFSAHLGIRRPGRQQIEHKPVV